MEFIYSDGGRSKYFKAKDAGDCVTRAICNASGKDYLEVYNGLKELAKHERRGKRKSGSGISSVRNGVFKNTERKYIEEILGWKRHACCGIGVSNRVHLKESELPKGTLIVQVSRHLTCVKDGVIYDTYDCSREGTRMVYGYWKENN